MKENRHPVSQKLRAPYINEIIVQRRRLIERVNEAGVDIVSIIAPAGFGKTVLLSQIAVNSKQPTVWYQLDEYDNDPAVFWQYLIVGCQRFYPSFGEEILFFVNNNLVSLNRGRTVLSMLIKEMEKCQLQVTLAFDDCHVLTKPEVTIFMEEFIQYLPTGVKVLIAGRKDALRINRLLVEGKILNIETGDLCFTRDDIACYSDEKGIVPAGTELDFIEKITEGWPLAVSLYVNSTLRKKTGIIKIDKQLLFNYMASEIVDAEDEDIQRFMTSIAVLEEITPEYCDRLLDKKDSRKILGSLQKKYFFFSTHDGENETYRYHQLFREYFLERLGSERLELLEKAGWAAYKAGELERAVEYYFAAGLSDVARKIIVKVGKKNIGRGNWHTVDRWLSKLTAEMISSDPWLSLYKAQMEINRGQIFAGENWINHALNSFINTTDYVGLAESRLLKAKTLRYQGRYLESIELIEAALPSLPVDESGQRFDPYLEKSYTLMLCGRFEEAEEVLLRALSLAEQRGDTVLMTYFYEGLGTVNFARGYYDRSLYYCRRGMAISPDKSLRNYYFHDSIGPIYLDWGELDRAYEYLKQSVTAKENFGLTEALPSAYCQFGNVLLDRGELLQAEEYFRKALSIMEEHGGDHFINTLTNFLLSVCLGAQGRLVEAQDLVDKARRQAGNQSDYLNGLFQVVECFAIMQTGNMEASIVRLHEILPMLEKVGARKLLCISYSALALMGILRGNEKDITDFAHKAITLAAEMNFVHDYLLLFDIYQPLLYLGLERGIEVTFLQRIIVRVGERAVSLLRKLAAYSDSSVRLRAIIPLAQIGSKEALEIIKQLGEDEETQVSELARRILQKLGSAPVVAAKSRTGKKEPIRLQLLGPVRIYSGNKEITHTNWIRSKSRDMLIYMAHLGSPAHKEKIMEAFWPEIPFQQANTLFHTTMHNLRHILEGETGTKDYILYQGGRYCLSTGTLLIDKLKFQELLADAGRAGQLDESAAALLEEAVNLYRGEYLEELDYFWALPEQEYLKQLHNKARDRLSLYYLNKKEFPQAILHLERLVRDNPLTEEYYQRLINAYAGIGDLKSINLQYHRFKVILKDELGLLPSQEVQNLYLRLINNR